MPNQMNWPNEVVEKVATQISRAPFPSKKSITKAQAALSSITLQDIAKLPEVRALVEALEKIADENNDECAHCVAQKTINLFTEASND